MITTRKAKYMLASIKGYSREMLDKIMDEEVIPVCFVAGERSYAILTQFRLFNPYKLHGLPVVLGEEDEPDSIRLVAFAQGKMMHHFTDTSTPAPEFSAWTKPETYGNSVTVEELMSKQQGGTHNILLNTLAEVDDIVSTFVLTVDKSSNMQIRHSFFEKDKSILCSLLESCIEHMREE
jgi:hypothetical protein